MNKTLKFFLYYYLVATLLALVYFTITYGRNNTIAKGNQLKREARKAYLEASYEQAFNDLRYLRDSLHLEENAITLNLSHAGYLLSRTDSSAILRDLLNNPDLVDSARRADDKEAISYARCLDHYRTLSELSGDDGIASIAYNQLGVITYTWRDKEAVEQEEKALAEAADQFRSALKKNSHNEIARYNYELIRLKIDYPKMVMEQVQSLIGQRRYREARKLLDEALKRDDLLRKKYSDYAQRIDNVIRIDSLSRS